MSNKGNARASSKKAQKQPPQDWKAAFIDRLHDTANVRESCEYACISRKTAYEHKNTDSEFAAQWDEALESACDILEARAWERSKTSDQLLMFLLRAHRPNKYAERLKQEITGANGQELFNHGLIASLLTHRPDGNNRE